MDKFPLLWMGKSVGELACERESLYTRFAARCRLPGEGLWCAWAVGERGELRLGVLEPEGAEASICRRFSGRMTQPLGPLLRGRSARLWRTAVIGRRRQHQITSSGLPGCGGACGGPRAP